VLERPLALTDLYRFPTIRGFSAAMSTDSSDSVKQTADRAARRRETMAARRRVRR
jgi:hypothetical protein